MTDTVEGNPGGDAPEALNMPGYQGDFPVMSQSEFESGEYKMSCQEGKVVIINNENFKPGWMGGKRVGTSADGRAAYGIFSDLLRYKDIRSEPDLEAHKMKKALKDAAENAQPDQDCFICVILTYGDEGFLYGTDGTKISINELLAPFKGNNCGFTGKPKIFFIQACPIQDKDPLGRQGANDEIRLIPTEADFFVFYSVAPGSLSWQPNKENGSWFIQAVAEAFKRFLGKLDFFTMMVRVMKKVSYDMKNAGHLRTKIPFISSTLTKNLFFEKKQ